MGPAPKDWEHILPKLYWVLSNHTAPSEGQTIQCGLTWVSTMNGQSWFPYSTEHPCDGEAMHHEAKGPGPKTGLSRSLTSKNTLETFTSDQVETTVIWQSEAWLFTEKFWQWLIPARDWYHTYPILLTSPKPFWGRCYPLSRLLQVLDLGSQSTQAKCAKGCCHPLLVLPCFVFVIGFHEYFELLFFFLVRLNVHFVILSFTQKYFSGGDD